MSGLRVAVESDSQGGTRITLAGEFDLATLPVFEEQRIDITGSYILVVAAELEYIGSEGLAEFLRLHQGNLGAGKGGLFIAGLHGEPKRAITVLGFDRLFVLLEEGQEPAEVLRARNASR